MTQKGCPLEGKEKGGQQGRWECTHSEAGEVAQHVDPLCTHNQLCAATKALGEANIAGLQEGSFTLGGRGSEESAMGSNGLERGSNGCRLGRGLWAHAATCSYSHQSCNQHMHLACNAMQRTMRGEHIGLCTQPIHAGRKVAHT